MDALLLRVGEVAELLGFGPTKVYQLIKAGRLPAVKVEGRVRVPRYAVEEYVAALPLMVPAAAASEPEPALAGAGAEKD